MNIRRGLRIVRKNKLAFILLLIVLITLSILITSVLVTIFEKKLSFSITNSKTRYYDAVPVSYTFDDLDKMIADISTSLSNGGETYFMSQSLNDKYHCNIIVIIGHLTNENYNRHICAVPKLKDNLKESHENINNKIKYEKIEKMNINDFNGSKYNFYTSQYDDLLDYNINTSELEEIIHNLKYSEIEIKLGIDMELINQFKDKSLKISLSESNGSNEAIFILKFVFVFTCSMLIMLYLSYLIINNNLLYKMRNENIINIICGASTKDIFVQNSVFITLLNLINLAFLIYISIHDNNIIAKIIMPVLCLFEYIIFELILYISIKNENLEKYIGGE